MPIRYSAAHAAFFDARLHAELPADAVPVSVEEHALLLQLQAAGHEIRAADDGRPVARRPAENTEQLRARLLRATRREAARRIERVAPLWRQLNDTRDLAAAEGERRAAIERRFAAIDGLRAASDRLEAALATMTPRQLARCDVGDDRHWQGDAT